MSTRQLLFSALVVGYFICSSLGTRQIIRSIALTSKQKRAHLVFMWLVPFFWYLIIGALHKKTTGSHEVPIKDDVSNNPFHESGKGDPTTRL